MENGLIFDVKRFALHDGPGIRTTVFFKGCPASCWWCHNPESQHECEEKSVRKTILDGTAYEDPEILGKKFSSTELMTEILKDRIFYEESEGGVTFSGGEPLIQAAFLSELLDLCRQQDLHTAIDTTGYANTEILDSIMGKVDLFLYDIKFIDEKLHEKYTGISNRLILKNLNHLTASGCNVNLRFPVIPGITNTAENIGEIMRYISNLGHRIVGIDLLPYHRIAEHKYHKLQRENLMHDTPEPDSLMMDQIRQQFESLKIPVRIGG